MGLPRCGRVRSSLSGWLNQDPHLGLHRVLGRGKRESTPVLVGICGSLCGSLDPPYKSPLDVLGFDVYLDHCPDGARLD